MKGNGKPFVCLTGLIVLCMLLLTACNGFKPPEDVTVSTLAIDQEGKVTLWLVEDFSQNYYQVDELKEMVEEEIEAFNADHGLQGLTAQVESVTMTDNEEKVSVRLLFNGVDAYRAYTGSVLFYGTVEEAGLLGYHPTGSFLSVKDGETVSAEEIPDLSQKHLLFTKEKLCIYGPYRPQYISGNAVLNEDYGVSVPGTEEYTYIIMK